MGYTMILNAWLDAFVRLFTNSANIIAMACLLIGIVLCCIECFIPGFGVFGITGIVFSLFSVVFTLIMGGQYAWIQCLYMICITVIILTTVILISVRSAKVGLISKSPLINTDVDLPQNYAENSHNYAYLVGKTGVAETILKPVGKVRIDDETYQVATDGEYIEKGTEVSVVKVDGSTIMVKKIGE